MNADATWTRLLSDARQFMDGECARMVADSAHDTRLSFRAMAMVDGLAVGLDREGFDAMRRVVGTLRELSKSNLVEVRR